MSSQEADASEQPVEAGFLAKYFALGRYQFKWFAFQVYTLGLALRDPRATWTARIAALFFSLYIISWIDLFPDVIPVIGILDDIAVIPLGFATIRFFVPDVIVEAADRRTQETGIPRALWRLFVGYAILLSFIWVLVFGFIVYRILNVVGIV